MDALEGVTIVDLTSHIAGPYASKVLADLGARVIKIERPGGDVARTLGPFLGDQPGVERSATFQFLNTNKESIVLDLDVQRGLDVLDALVGLAGVVVASPNPSAWDRIGIDYEWFARRTRAPLVTLTNFGWVGPYRDYRLSDTVLFAMGGEMFSHGLADREPLKMGGTAALLQCGAMCAIAALGAIHAFELHGVGQHVDVPMFDTQINSIDRRSSTILAYRFSGRIQQRPENSFAGIAGGIYPCADGYIEVTASAGDYWNRFVEMLDEPVFREPRWANPTIAADPVAKEEADGLIYGWMLSHTMEEIWAAARKARAIVAPVFTGIDLFNDPVLRERGLWEDVEHAVLGKLPMLGRPYMLEKTPWRLRRPAPMLGEHTDSILAECGYLSTAIRELRKLEVVA